MKTATVTLVEDHGKHIVIHAGFLFGFDLINPDKNLFGRIGSPDSIKRAVEDCDIIYTSMHCTTDLEDYYDIIDDRWLVGGPLTKWIKEFDIKIPCRYTEKTIGEYLGTDQDLTKLTPYFENIRRVYPGKNAMIPVSFGGDCHWHKCRFCSCYSGRPPIKASDVPKIVEQVENLKYDYYIAVATPTVSPAQVKHFMETKRSFRHFWGIMAIPDDSLIKVLEQFDNNELTNASMCMGLEAMNEHNRDILNKKGTSNRELIETARNTIRLNGKIDFTLMTGYWNTTKQDYEEAKWLLEQFESIIPPEKVEMFRVSDSNTIRWPERQRKFLEENSPYPIIEVTGDGRIDSQVKSLIVNIPKDSDAYKYNHKIIDLVLNSKLCNSIPSIQCLRTRGFNL